MRLLHVRAATAVIMALAMVAVMGQASLSQAAEWATDEQHALSTPSTSQCPTLAKAPRPIEAWFNIADMEKRGFYDPGNQTPWDFSIRTAQIICGAKEGSTIKLGMYFIRALGTITMKRLGDSEDALGDRPETDPEVMFQALEYVKKERNVKVGFVLDGGPITTKTAKNLINKRLKALLTAPGATKPNLYWCTNGCYNVNKSSVFPSAITHEKFISISDTVWDDSAGPHPVVLSTSGNWARSQVRNYWQEATLIYDDVRLFTAFDTRYNGMVDCVKSGCNPEVMTAMQLKKQRNIWVDPLYRHPTDAGRGTTVSFSPATADARDYYVQQFDDVDCTVDSKIRIAMFKLTDSKATSMVNSLVRLRKRGCDIKMVLTSQGGATTISPTVVKLLSANKIPTTCSAFAMHTKMILIGPTTSNAGRVLAGTANMSVSGLRYSEEHVITFDTRRATGRYVEELKRAYGEYLAGWYELHEGSKKC